MHLTCVILFVYDNAEYVPSRFMHRGVRKAWAGVWPCGGVFSCLWWGLSVTPVCCCGVMYLYRTKLAERRVGPVTKFEQPKNLWRP